MPDTIWRGVPKRSWREWKERQTELLGTQAGLVAIVRCHHGTNHLNLGYYGHVYTSGLEWEDALHDPDLKNRINPAARVLADRGSAKQLRPGDLPPRDPHAPARLIDLTTNYNALLCDSWQGFPGNTLALMSRGLQQFKGVPFDVRGVIQVRGDEEAVTFPTEIADIAVHQRFRRLHVLHGATLPALDGHADLGDYMVLYSNGQTNSIPVVYFKNIADWWFDPQKPTKPLRDAQVAWTGTNEAAEAFGKSLRIYMTTWDNPLPDVEVATISIISHVRLSAPFLLAITVDP